MLQTHIVYLRTVIAALVGTILAIWCFLPIPYGAVYHSSNNVGNLHGLIVNGDPNGAVGMAIAQALGTPSPPAHPTFALAPNGFSTEAISDALIGETTWAVVQIASDVTQNLQHAQRTANQSWVPASAITVWASQARNSDVVSEVLGYVEAVLNGVLTNLNQKLPLSYIESMAGNTSALTTTLSTAPQTVFQPLSYQVQYVTSFNVPAASVTELVGLIILLVLALIQAAAGFMARSESKLTETMSLPSLIALRLLSNVATSFILGWAFSGVAAAFGVPFSNFYKGGFVIYFVCIWLSLLSMALAGEFLFSVLPLPGIPIFTIFFLLANASVILAPMEVMPKFYRYGYFMIFYNARQIINALIFGTRNHMGVNFGVLLGWVGVSFVTVPFATWLDRRRARREAVKPERATKEDGSFDGHAHA